jgi:hypothetical protein
MVEEPDDGMQGLALNSSNNSNAMQTVILEDGTRVQVKL